jgi:hypothetical protein
MISEPPFSVLACECGDFDLCGMGVRRGAARVAGVRGIQSERVRARE